VAPCSRRIDHSFDAVPANVGELRHTAVEFAAGHGAPSDMQDDIALAVSEAASNAVVHAYRAQPEAGAMHLEARAGTDEIHIRIKDDGCGMAPRVDSPGLGLGLALIAQLADWFEVTTDRGTAVAMCFALRPAPARVL
jgi:serine/threonine-protein kinase RsbW